MGVWISPAVAWAILGFVLLIIEIFTTTFFVAFFGVAALVIAGLAATGLVTSLTNQLFIFGILGGSGLLVFRRKLVATLQSRPGHSTDKGQIITASAAIAPHAVARIEYQGAIWEATNASEAAITAGDRIVIVSTAGIKLVVRPAP
jgi:membrane protein implicated in regulation of membrane protease activity